MDSRVLGLTVFYDTGSGGQYLSGAIANALGDNVAPYEFRPKEVDKDGVNLEQRNRWFFNTRDDQYEKDKVNIFVTGDHATPLDFKQDDHKEFDKIIKVRISCHSLWELIMSSFNCHLKNSPDSNFKRYYSDFINFEGKPDTDFSVQFELDCANTEFDIEFPYVAFYDKDLQKEFCNKLEKILDKPVDCNVLSNLCEEYVQGNKELYKRLLVNDL